MTDQEKNFLHLCVVEQMSYNDIVKTLNVPKSTLTQWYESLKEQRTVIANIRNLWTRKKIEISFADFYKWYLSHERKCFYCGITESEIERLLIAEKIKN